jgi:hypothetical protein
LLNYARTGDANGAMNYILKNFDFFDRCIRLLGYSFFRKYIDGIARVAVRKGVPSFSARVDMILLNIYKKYYNFEDCYN